LTTDLQALEQQTVVDLETAAKYLNIGRTLAYRLGREEGRLCEGVRVLRVGRLLRVPCSDLLSVLRPQESHRCACKVEGR